METSSVLPDTSDETQCNYCGTILWICVCVATTLVTVLGNVLTMLAISLSKRLSSMMANYFVFSLAVSDLLVGFSIPYHMLFYTTGFGSSKTSCLLRFVFTSFACASSISNLVVIAMDRYVAIVYPLHYSRFMTKKRVCFLIATGWVTATTMASVPLIWNDWHEGVRCELVHVVPHNFLAWVVCPTFALTWTAMLLLYSRICREANGHVKRIRETTGTGLQDGQVISTTTRDSKSFQLMLMILGCFTVCWLPYFVVTMYLHELIPNVYEISLNLAMANSSMNPLIYAWKNANFRKAFLSLLKCRTPDDIQRYITDHVPSKRGSMNNIVGSVKNECSEMHRKQGKSEYFADHCSQGRYDSTYETVISIN
nr:unnamed protein product [Callosobruchus chinensis]